MNRRKQRAAGLRTASLHRAEAASTNTYDRGLVARCLAAWREPTWRSRRELRRSLNILMYKVATAQARSGLLTAVFGGWADALRADLFALKRELEAQALNARARLAEMSSYPPPPGLALRRPSSLCLG